MIPFARTCLKTGWIFGVAGAFLLGLLVPLGAQVALQGGGSGSGLRMPLEHYENGAIKRQLFADSARPGTEAIEAKTLRVEFYDVSGQVEMRVTAGDCTYNRKTGRITTESDVRMDAEGLTITGKGLDWSGEKEVLVIKRDVKLVFSGERSRGGLKGLTEDLKKERKQ